MQSRLFRPFSRRFAKFPSTRAVFKHTGFGTDLAQDWVADCVGGEMLNLIDGFGAAGGAGASAEGVCSVPYRRPRRSRPESLSHEQGEPFMPKGQQRGNKEAKKPKKVPQALPPAAPAPAASPPAAALPPRFTRK